MESRLFVLARVGDHLPWLSPRETRAYMREPQQDQIPNPLSVEQFESLAAPIALYPTRD